MLRQTLGLVAAVVATVGVAYFFWVFTTVSKDFSNVPKTQVNDVFVANLPKYKKYFAVFFVIFSAVLAIFVVIAVTAPK